MQVFLLFPILFQFGFDAVKFEELKQIEYSKSIEKLDWTSFGQQNK